MKGSSIYLNVKDLKLLMDIFANDVVFSENDDQTEEKERVMLKIIRLINEAN